MRRLIVVALFAIGAFGAAPDARAVVMNFATPLAPEVAGSSGTGDVFVTYDNVAHTLVIDASWDDLTGTTTVAHIHCCVAPPGTVGVAVTPGTLPGFPVGTTTGTYISPVPIDLTDAASYTAAFLAANGGTTAGAEAGLITGMLDGLAYFNIHSNFSPSGEIRGFLQLVTTPEPATLALFGLAVAGIAVSRRRRA